MQANFIDVVRLGLLVLFLWAQQRRHPQRYLRYWLVGWVSVFLSYVVWGLRGVTPEWLAGHALGFNFVLLGVLIFMLALLPKLDWSRRMLQVGFVLGAVGVLLINMQDFVALPRWVLALMVLAWQGDGMYIASRLLIGKLARVRGWIFAICGLYGFAMVLYVTTTPADALASWAVAEVLLCTAVLNWFGGKKGSVARWVGTIGFVTWAGFYFADLVLVDPTPAQRVLHQFWSFPKSAVAATMILKIFEDAKDEQAQLAEEFRELYKDFRMIYESHPDPMWICDGETGRFLMANQATLAVYGYSMAELEGMRMAGLVAPAEEDAEPVEEELDEAAEGMRLRHWHKDGRVVWVNVVDREITYLGKKARFVVVHDITKRLKLDLELVHRAQHDVLTGLPNRQLLKDRLEQCINACEREQRRAAILTIDIDHFKLINDTHGHLVGDECLQVVADRLKSKIRKVDTIARTGGEEFMAVVSGLNDVSDAEKVAASLLRVFEKPLELSIGKLPVTVSIGVAVYPDDAMEVETLKRLSDEALYRAKRRGRNRAAYGSEISLLDRYAPGVIAARVAAGRLKTL